VLFSESVMARTLGSPLPAGAQRGGGVWSYLQNWPVLKYFRDRRSEAIRPTSEAGQDTLPESDLERSAIGAAIEKLQQCPKLPTNSCRSKNSWRALKRRSAYVASHLPHSKARRWLVMFANRDTSFRQKEKPLRLQCRCIDPFVGMAIDFCNRSYVS
jgi:hypothetical protein